jgi:hypothetical protein
MAETLWFLELFVVGVGVKGTSRNEPHLRWSSKIDIAQRFLRVPEEALSTSERVWANVNFNSLEAAEPLPKELDHDTRLLKENGRFFLLLNFQKYSVNQFRNLSWPSNLE